MKRKQQLIILLFALINMNAFSQTIPSYIPLNGLVGWWPFNANANDLSGHNYNGNVYGASLTNDRFGNANSAYQFLGTEYIEVPFINPFVAQSHTIICWIKSNQTSSGRLIVLPAAILPAGEDQHFSLNLNADLSLASIYFDKVCGPGSRGVFASSSSPVNDNNWHHIVGIIDSVNLEFRIYVDGQLENTIGYNCGPTSNTTNYLQFGRYGYGSAANTENYVGVLDDILIYNRVLTECEVQQIYDGAITCNPPTNLTTTNITSTSAKLNWQLNSICSNIINYQIKYKPKSSSSWVTINSTTIYKSINGLAPSTQYQWKVRTKCSSNPNVYSAFSPIKNFTTKPLRLANGELPQLVQVFPNPANSEITIASEKAISKIELVNMVGSIIKSEININTAAYNVDLNNIQAGIYFIRITTDDGTVVKKFAKKD